MVEKVIIVGCGQAGGQTAISLRQKQYEGSVTLVGDEQYIPYERPHLSKQFLMGSVTLERIFMRHEDFYKDKNIVLNLKTRVDRINRDNRSITLRGGKNMPYSQLVLATGALVQRLSCPGVNLDGIHYLRTINDVLGFRDRLTDTTNLVIIGGGYIGLEVAAVGRKRGCQVTVLEKQSMVMNRVVVPSISQFYESVHRSNGVDIQTSITVAAFEGNRCVERVICNDGQVFPADTVVVGIGILPNTDLALKAGLSVDNGIVVDNYTRTSDRNIFAVGDCTNHPNSLLGQRLRLESVQNALSQGKAAAAAITRVSEPYAEIPWFWSDQYNLKLQMVGLSNPGDKVVLRGSIPDHSFSACYIRNNTLVAVHAINRPKDFMQAKKIIAAKAKIDVKRLVDSDLPLNKLV